MILPCVSIVVIGLNEASNLKNTFNAIMNMNYPLDNIELIYVDSGSKDGSVKIAKQYTDKIYIEQSRLPSAGLVRNRGIIEAKFDIIHFIDGDIQIDPNYLRKAIAKIESDDIHAVYGYLVELKQGGINEILLSHWKDKKEGFSNGTGGGGTYRKKCLVEIDGYDERVIRGQERELGERFLNAGYKIWFINQKMGTHNYDVNNSLDYLKTIFIDGQAKLINYLIKADGLFFRQNNRKLKSLVFQNLLMFFLFIIALIRKDLLIVIVPALIYFSFLFIKYLFVRRLTDVKVLAYFILMNLTKTIAFAGMVFFLIKYFFDKTLLKPKMVLNR